MSNVNSSSLFGFTFTVEGLTVAEAAAALTGAGAIVGNLKGYDRIGAGTWQVLLDPSLCGAGCEVATPPLEGPGVFELVGSFLAALRSAGATLSDLRSHHPR